MRCIVLLALLAISSALDGCDVTMNIQEVRVAHVNQIYVDKNNRWICVVTPKRDSYTIMSLSFLPTTCIAYPEDVFPQQHPFSKDHTLFRVRILRDQCASEQTTYEPFVVTIKSAYEYTPGKGFDKAVPVYFTVAVTITFILYFPIMRIFSKLFREDSVMISIDHFDMAF